MTTNKARKALTNKTTVSSIVLKIRNFFMAIWAFIKKNRWVQILIIVLTTLFMVVMAFGVSYAFIHRNDPVQIGVSFSKKYSEELGNDWRANYRALLEDINFDKLRLMSYWDENEPKRYEYNFSDLDWQMDEAELNNAKISLSVGLRQPRWPECHYPDWARDLETDEMQTMLLVYIEQVVLRYRNHPALESYQVENEVANKHFGDCPAYDRDFYAQEIDLIKSLDSENLVITNASNQSGFPIRSQVGDKVGFSVYRRAHFEALGRQVTWSFWYVPSWWHGMRAMAVEILHDADTFIHELQAEPWGPKPTQELTIEEQYRTMNPDKFIEITNYVQSTGMKEYYLWGGEWWYWLKNNHGNPDMWNVVKAKVESTRF